MSGSIGARRGSYFFAIDACIAAIVITSALIIIYGSHAFSPPSAQAFATADGFLGYLAQTPIGSFDDPVVRGWIAQGVVNDTSVSLLYQLALFNVTGRNAEAVALAGLAIEAVPSQIGVDVRIQGGSYANRSITTEPDAPVRVVVKRIVIVRTSPASVAAPVVVEVRSWQ